MDSDYSPEGIRNVDKRIQRSLHEKSICELTLKERVLSVLLLSPLFHLARVLHLTASTFYTHCFSAFTALYRLNIRNSVIAHRTFNKILSTNVGLDRGSYL